jgi:transposase-like protein
MERRKFTREFKLEAVRLIKERGVSYAQAPHDLSVHQSQLRSWVKALAADPQHAFPGQVNIGDCSITGNWQMPFKACCLVNLPKS